MNQATETILTKQRKAVLDAVRNSESHLTASEVYISARNILPSISYATVYNSLRYLKDEGLIDEVNFGNGASRYDKTVERHDHAICVQCEKLVDFNLELSQDLLDLAAKHSQFKPQTIQLTLKGLCADCAAK
ncbi:MAG: transcriptional repressor [Pyrinomonadaceae bacterium]|nr:transcriptional repressor [Pyrinomonadaceae bacterium]